LAAGDALGAAAIHLAPFLDGFHLSGRGEFGSWVDQTRAGLLQQLMRSLERALRDADSDQARVEITRELVRLEPYSTKHALALAAALEAIHEPVLAYRILEGHVARLSTDLELEPAESVERQLSRLRTVTQALAAAPPVQAAAAPAPAAAATTPSAARPRGLGRRQLARRWVLTSAMVVAGVVVASVFIQASRGGGEQPVLAIGRIDGAIEGQADSLGPLLTQALVMSTGRIAGIGVLSSRWLAEFTGDGSAGGIRAAASAGASELLEGRVSRSHDGGLHLSLTLTDVRSGRVRSATNVTAIDPLSLVDSATRVIAAVYGVAVQGEGTPAMGTSSWTALSFYREGGLLIERGDLVGAYRMFTAALGEDSTFAAAAFWAWQASSLLSLPNQHALESQASRFAATAPIIERLYILGHIQVVDFRSPDALIYADSLFRLFPDHPLAHLLSGQVEMALGDFPAAVAHFRQAIAVAAEQSEQVSRSWRPCMECGAIELLAGAYVWMDSLTSAERMLRAALVQWPRNGRLVQGLMHVLQRQGHDQEVRQLGLLMATLVELPPDLGFMAEQYALRAGDPVLAEQLLQNRQSPVTAESRRELLWLELIALRNQGRRRDALRFAREGTLAPKAESVGESDWHAAPETEALVRQEAGEYMLAAELFLRAAGPPTDRQPGSGRRAWWLTHAATCLAAAGETERLPALADTIEVLGSRSLYGRDRRLHHYVRGLMEQGRGRDVGAVRHFREAVYSPNEGYSRINFELGRSLMRLGRPAEAAAVVAPALRGSLDASNLYVTRTELHELLAEAYDQAGARDSAIAHYRIVSRSWAKADSVLQPRVARVRNRMVELGAPPS